MKKTYYRAELEDFTHGRIFEQRWDGTLKWRALSLHAESFRPINGFSWLNEAIVHLDRFKGREPYYRIQHLHQDDFLARGFREIETKKLDDSIIELEDMNQSVYIQLHPKEQIVHIYDWFEGDECIPEEVLFRGKLLDQNELDQVLTFIGFKKDPKRKFKFEPIKTITEIYGE